MLLKNEWVNNEIKEEIKKYVDTNDNENTTIQKSMGCSKSSYSREVHSYIGLPQKTRKISNNLTYHLKELGKNKQNLKSAEGRK